MADKLDPLDRIEAALKNQMQSHLKMYRDGVVLPCRCPVCESSERSLAAVVELRDQMSVSDRIRANAAECLREIIAEREQLRAQLQEAIEALRKINKWDQQEHTCGEDDGPCLPCKIGETARTALAKHPEVK